MATQIETRSSSTGAAHCSEYVQLQRDCGSYFARTIQWGRRGRRVIGVWKEVDRELAAAIACRSDYGLTDEWLDELGLKQIPGGQPFIDNA